VVERTKVKAAYLKSRSEFFLQLRRRGDALRTIHHRRDLIFRDEDGSMLNPAQFHAVLWADAERHTTYLVLG
jgi:hypothetical protein